MFKMRPNQSLIELIRAKEAQPEFNSTTSLLWSLLRIYAGCRDAIDSVKHFEINLTPGCSQREYSLRWLVQLVLRESLHQQVFVREAGQYGQLATIEDAYFVQTSSQFVR